jgi:predicted DNA-binding protein (MmcQ/YjbR family)
MFAAVPCEPGPLALSFKCTPEEFAELIEKPGCIPAPYVAKHKWVALERMDALPKREIERLIRTSYDLVVAKLPKKARAALAGG